MVIPQFITIKDKNNSVLCYISPMDGLKECYADAYLNGESTFTFMLPATSEKLTHIKPESFIWTTDRVYTIMKPESMEFTRDENDEVWVKVSAIERWALLDRQFKTISNDPNIPNPVELSVFIVSGGDDLSGGLYPVGSAAHALNAILEDTGWTMGTVDVDGIYDAEAEKASVLELIKYIQDMWGGLLIFDSINKTISLRNPNNWQVYNGFHIRYQKNLKTIRRKDDNDIITRLYAFGKDDLHFADVNSNKKYVENFTYTDSVYIGIYRNEDILTPSALLTEAQKNLVHYCKPRYNYKTTLVDLRTLPEYSHEDFSLGHMCFVVDSDIGVNSLHRIIRHRYNYFEPWICELEIGEPDDRFIEKLKASFDIAGYLSDTVSSRGQLSGWRIQDGSIPSMKIIDLTADKITAGTIDANVISVINLVVGSNVTMGPNAYISWGNVNDKPTIPTQYTDAMALSAIESTYIDANGVWTPNVYAQNIVGTAITGIVIKTSADGTGRMVLQGAGLICYDNLNRKNGICIEDGTFDYGSLTFYKAGSTYWEINYDDLGKTWFHTYSGTDIVFDPAGEVNFNSRPVDFTGSTITGLNVVAKFG
jgi:hypothetical protein